MQSAGQAAAAAAAADYGSAGGCVLFMTRLLPFKIHQHTLMEVKLEALDKAWAWEMHFPLLLSRTAVSKKATRRGWEKACGPPHVSVHMSRLRNQILVDMQGLFWLNLLPSCGSPPCLLPSSRGNLRPSTYLPTISSWVLQSHRLSPHTSCEPHPLLSSQPLLSLARAVLRLVLTPPHLFSLPVVRRHVRMGPGQ